MTQWIILGGKWNLLGGYYEIIVSKRSLEMWTWKFTGTEGASKEIIKVSLIAKQLCVPGLTSGMNPVVSSPLSLCPLLDLQEERIPSYLAWLTETASWLSGSKASSYTPIRH